MADAARSAISSSCVQSGDAISIDSSTPHRLSTAGDEPVHAIWFVLGRHSHDGASAGNGASHGHAHDDEA